MAEELLGARRAMFLAFGECITQDLTPVEIADRLLRAAIPPSPSTAEDEMPALPEPKYCAEDLAGQMRAYGQACARAAFGRGFDEGHIAGREKGMIAGRRAALSANAADREAKEAPAELQHDHNEGGHVD